MGKISRKRTSVFHLPSRGTSLINETNGDTDRQIGRSMAQPQPIESGMTAVKAPPHPRSVGGSDNLFRNVHIDPLRLLTQTGRLAGNESVAMVTDAASGRHGNKTDLMGSGKHSVAKKRDRRKLKHDLFIQKLEGAHRANINKKLRKKRESTVVVGDLHPLLETIADIADTNKHKDIKLVNNSKISKLKLKQRVKEHKTSVNLFKQVLQHKDVKANPWETIRRHLEVKISKDI